MDSEKIHLEKFQPILLDEMKEVELMNRIDTKFVLSRDVLSKVLPELEQGYRALEVEGTRLNAYQTQYFDTDKYKFFLDHHNGTGTRYKVRIRKYVESSIYFLEVKRKYKGRTVKKRISIADFEPELSEGSQEFVNAVLDEEFHLEQKLYNTFKRITLVNKEIKERLTIDLNLAYNDKAQKLGFDHIVIAELKQERFNTQSLFYRMMKKHIIRPSGFSKYCIGALSLNEELKYNNFKSKLLLMDKLK